MSFRPDAYGFTVFLFAACRREVKNVFQKLFRWIFSLLGMACGAGIFFAATYLIRLIPSAPEISQLWYFILGAVCIVVTGLIFFLIAPHVQRGGEQFTRELDDNLKKIPVHEFICGTAGLILGLLIAFLISSLWRGWSVPWWERCCLRSSTYSSDISACISDGKRRQISC